MSITYSIEVVDNILRVKASGKDDDVNDVMQYGEALIKAAIEANTARVLCDEKDLEYSIGTLDTFKAAEHIAKTAPKVARIAFVCQPQYIEDGQFWETVAVNRGLVVRMFTNVEDAEAWLKSLAK